MAITYGNENGTQTHNYQLQDDETFVEQVEIRTKLYGIFSLISIVSIPILVVLYLFADVSEMLPMFYGLVAWTFLILLYTGSTFIKHLHTNAFLTSKRIYVKTTKDGDYLPYDKDNIQSFSSLLHIHTLHTVDGNKISIPALVKADLENILNKEI